MTLWGSSWEMDEWMEHTGCFSPSSRTMICCHHNRSSSNLATSLLWCYLMCPSVNAILPLERICEKPWSPNPWVMSWRCVMSSISIYLAASSRRLPGWCSSTCGFSDWDVHTYSGNDGLVLLSVVDPFIHHLSIYPYSLNLPKPIKIQV